MLLDFLLLLILILISYQDIRFQQFNSIWLALPLFLGALFYHTPIFIILTGYIICLTINVFTQEHYIGNGDLDVLATILFYVNFYEFWLICCLACGIQIVFHYINTQKTLPFVPAITFSFGIIVIYSFLF
jgi:prepilin signal peptidase PulO-like enzyme (type II secretory pathway)